MERIVNLLKEVRTRLGEQLSELRYVGPDRGELTGHRQPEAWPCALLDVKRVDCTLGSSGRRMADVRIIVTVADSVEEMGGSSDDCRAVGLAGKVYGVLEAFAFEGFGPLCCTELRRIEVAGADACYRLTWRTAFEIDYGSGYDSVRISRVKLEL